MKQEWRMRVNRRCSHPVSVRMVSVNFSVLNNEDHKNDSQLSARQVKFRLAILWKPFHSMDLSALPLFFRAILDRQLADGEVGKT